MTELQEKMLHLQTITTIMNEEAILRQITKEEKYQNPNLDVENQIIVYNLALANMKRQLISEILNNEEFYTPLDNFVSNMNNSLKK